MNIPLWTKSEIINHIPWKLFLDDIRTPPGNFTLARSYTQAQLLIRKFGCPYYISFDHDLGEEKTGYDFAKWLIEVDRIYRILPENFDYIIHSQNPVGAVNIFELLERYLDVR
jgi:hypothetical protein